MRQWPAGSPLTCCAAPSLDPGADTRPASLAARPAAELRFAGDSAAAAQAIARGKALGLGALLTRYLVESPPNVCTPG